MEESCGGSPPVLPLEYVWERTFDAIPDLIMILDDQHRIARVNRAMAAQIGRECDEIVGRKCYEVVHGSSAIPFACPHADLLRTGGAHAAEVRDERRGGTFLVSVSPLRNREGHICGSVHVARDITSQKRAEAEARRAARQRETFLALLSHELRNPVGAILSAVHILKRTPGHETSACAALAVIERQAAQMSCLLNDLLDVSRIMQGKIEIRREPVDLGELTASAVAAVRPVCDEHGLTIDLQLPEYPLYVEGDAARLRQVAVNLLTNASKYTPHGGRIWVTVHADGTDVVLQARDNGGGIPPDKLESIFDLFGQADCGPDRQQGGLGIGLPLVRMLVALHGGSVLARSAGLGTGSEFVVLLPALSTRAAEQDELALRAGTAPAVRVLIIEDNSDSRTMLQALLQLDGHDVSVAEDGVTGLNALRTEEFDVALIDIGLPGIDGYEIVRQFRSLRRKRQPRLIALTGYGRPSDRQAVIDAGFDEHLVKPCSPEELERILRRPR